jgi:hypothetical protein
MRGLKCEEKRMWNQYALNRDHLETLEITVKNILFP